MKVADLIEQRRPGWLELERLCDRISSRSASEEPDLASRFSTLYRAACADLALAESYQLPPSTVDYLHRLVARAHNQMYRSRSFQLRTWSKRIFQDTPQQIFHDPCVQICTALFWGLFLISAYLGYQNVTWPGFAEQVIGMKNVEMYTEMYEKFGDRDSGASSAMLGFYILNNASIGLSCFVMMLFVLPGLITLCYNAVMLGAVFGYMFRPELGDASHNFKVFVTAHGPFELTAIVLSAGAGLKIGLSWLMTHGLKRSDSMIKAGREALPIAMCAVGLFCLAAMIEGFISPMSETYLPWWIKGLVAVCSSSLLMVYFVILGYPRQRSSSGEESVDES